MDIQPVARDLTLAIAIDCVRQGYARTRAAINCEVLTKQEATIFRRSALTINAADRFCLGQGSLLDRARLWFDEAAAEDFNQNTASTHNLHPSPKWRSLLALLPVLSALHLPSLLALIASNTFS
jgi:hypothetical protein